MMILRICCFFLHREDCLKQKLYRNKPYLKNLKTLLLLCHPNIVIVNPGPPPARPSCVGPWRPRWNGWPRAEPACCAPAAPARWSGDGCMGGSESKGWTLRWWRWAAPSTVGLGLSWLHWWWGWRHCWSRACQLYTSGRRRNERNMVRGDAWCKRFTK